jgi:hypothetical protein
MGEVGFFAWQFAETGDFKCTFNEEGTCSQTPSREEILAIYNGSDRHNWPHVRRIHFMFVKINYYHKLLREYNASLIPLASNFILTNLELEHT